MTAARVSVVQTSVLKNLLSDIEGLCPLSQDGHLRETLREGERGGGERDFLELIRILACFFRGKGRSLPMC